MRLLILSLSMVFISSLTAYFWVRIGSEGIWKPLILRELPKGLWFSTIILLASSFTIELAQRVSARIWYPVTFVLSIVFLFSQILNWIALAQMRLGPTTPNLYAFTFYFLTWLHSAHLLGGMIPLTWISVKSIRYRGLHLGHGSKNLAIYWHFLAVVWLVLFTILKLS